MVWTVVPQSPSRFVVCSFITRSLGVSLDVKGEACGNDFHESMQVNVSQCKSMYDGQDINDVCRHVQGGDHPFSEAHGASSRAGHL